ncbi:hypothetical protein KFE80_07005 [bacterium SCSIO 12696]|nr:hypothetical protein KFE80_07005 [bacterium SCSIO 12696]
MELDKKSKDLGKTLVKLFAKELYIAGLLKEEELSDLEKVGSLIKEYILDHPDGIYMVTDHRETLYKKAKSLIDSNEVELAIVVYVMFFEHSINSVITRALEKKEISKKSKNEILRSANLKAKLTWVLELLELPKFNEKHVKFILQIADQRNAFVHYKFNAYNVNDDKTAPLIEILNEADKSAKYIKTYEARVIYNGKKSTVNKKLSNLGGKP